MDAATTACKYKIGAVARKFNVNRKDSQTLGEKARAGRRDVSLSCLCDLNVCIKTAKEEKESDSSHLITGGFQSRLFGFSGTNTVKISQFFQQIEFLLTLLIKHQLEMLLTA